MRQENRNLEFSDTLGGMIAEYQKSNITEIGDGSIETEVSELF